VTAAPLTACGTYPAETIAWFYERGYWTSETLPDVLDRRAATSPDRPLIIDGPIVLTNAQVREGAYRVAAGMHALGVRAGDRIAVQLPNWPEYVLTYFALARLGAVIVPLMPIYRHKEVAYILDLTEASAYVGTSGEAFDHVAMARDLRGDLPGLKTIVTVRSAAQPGEVRYEDLVAGHGVPDGGLLGPRPDPDAGHSLPVPSRSPRGACIPGTATRSRRGCSGCSTASRRTTSPWWCRRPRTRPAWPPACSSRWSAARRPA
jgi:cyclohexanecarboxylate-CoA ligase/acyl-CoA synthetase